MKNVVTMVFDGITPVQNAEEESDTVISINYYQWEKHCHGLFELPVAA